MALLPVIKYGHPTLRITAAPIPPGEALESFIEDMIETMETLDGVGLAATQVNVKKRLLVAKDIDRKKLYVLLNPVIIAYSEKKESDIEGCLSLPGLQGNVPRHHRIIIRAQTSAGETVEIEAKGHFARVLQHEIDHLNGVLYIDRAEPDSLEWVFDKGKNDYTTEPTTLADIQREYLKKYHSRETRLIFDAVQG
jgi:peptide deformylase